MVHSSFQLGFSHVLNILSSILFISSFPFPFHSSLPLHPFISNSFNVGWMLHIFSKRTTEGYTEQVHSASSNPARSICRHLQGSTFSHCFHPSFLPYCYIHSPILRWSGDFPCITKPPLRVSFFLAINHDTPGMRCNHQINSTCHPHIL